MRGLQKVCGKYVMKNPCMDFKIFCIKVNLYLLFSFSMNCGEYSPILTSNYDLNQAKKSFCLSKMYLLKNMLVQ